MRGRAKGVGVGVATEARQSREEGLGCDTRAVEEEDKEEDDADDDDSDDDDDDMDDEAGEEADMKVEGVSVRVVGVEEKEVEEALEDVDADAYSAGDTAWYCAAAAEDDAVLFDVYPLLTADAADANGCVCVGRIVEGEGDWEGGAVMRVRLEAYEEGLSMAELSMKND